MAHTIATPAAAPVTERISVSTALRRIAACKGRVAALTARVVAANVCKEDDPPAFDLVASLAERESTVYEMLRLQFAVARSNATTKLSNGLFVGEAVRGLAELKSLIDVLKKLPVKSRAVTEEKSQSYEYDMVSEKNVKVTEVTRWHCRMTTTDVAARVDALNEEFAALNALVEASNHETKVDVVKS